VKILLAGRMDGWMGIYWDQFAQSLVQSGVESQTFDYRAADPRGMLRKVLPGDAEDRIQAARTEALLDQVTNYGPDLVLTHSTRFLFPRIRDGFDGALFYWDIDGPAGPLAREEPPDLTAFDMILTVSRVIQRRLREHTTIPVRYLPHAADLDFYSPGILTPDERKRFTAPFTFLGRPTERRVEYLSPLASEGLIVWGKRWSKKPWKTETFKPCIREKGNIEGDEVVACYRATDVLVNISREPFVDPPTTLNLQVYHVPATGTCLLTEKVEELEEAFEVGKEVLAFESPEELLDKARSYSRHRDEAQRIGEMGRRRCEAEHSMAHRAKKLIDLVKQVRG
jgi:glycosyltransferase involved in cell wall biosynthesis